MSPRRPKKAAGTLSPLLVRIIHALERVGASHGGHAEALRAYGKLAFVQVPARGIFHPGTRDEYELYAAIESVASAHLEFAEARTALRRALNAAGLPLERRDPIESACLQMQSASDTAYFYAGLAFGVTFADFTRRP